MNSSHKFSLPFILAVTLHLTILVLFGLGFTSDSESVKQKPLPDIVQATILDDDKIVIEADRLKTKEKEKQLKQEKKLEELEQKRKKEQDLLQNLKDKRQQEEKKAKEVEKKQKLLKKQKAEEAAKLAKIKLKKEAEKKRQEELREAAEKKRKDQARKAAEKKRELERKAEQKRKQDLIAKQKAEAAANAEQLKQQAAAAHAKTEQNRQASISATAAIQQKVNNRWIKPQTSRHGLSCTIRVKLLPSGDVMNATVVKTSGDSVFDRSAENAVRKASPLPVPKDRNLFSKQFRTFTFEFKPK